MARPKNRDRVPSIFPARRKTCPMCQQELPWTMFYPRAKAASGHVLKVRSKCKLCESAIASEKWQALTDDEKRQALDAKMQWWRQMRDTDEAWVEEQREINAAQNRLRYANDPAYREKVKAKARAQKQLPGARERQNIARRARIAEARAARAEEAKRRLPVGPLRDWLTQQIAASDVETVAAALGIVPRVLYRWMHELDDVRLDDIDRALTGAGHPELLMDLWPELYDFEEATSVAA